MSGLGKAVSGGVETQHFGRPALHVEPTAYLQRNAGGWLRARFWKFAGAVRYADVHMGLDIAAAAGTPILAREAGIIRAHLWDDVRGRIILLEIRPGTICEDQHLASFVAPVGARVQRGQVIAKMGSTGQSTGSHDHSQICHHPTQKDWRQWRNWYAYNPERLEVGGDLAGVPWIKPL